MRVLGVIVLLCVSTLMVASGLPASAQHDVPAPPTVITTQAPKLPKPIGKTSLPVVPAVLPTELKIDAIGLDVQFGSPIQQEYNSATGRWEITPPESTLEDLQKVYVWGERSLPGSPSEGTTFVYGHTCRTCSGALNHLQDLAGHENGALIQLITPRGTLVYAVDKTESIPKGEIGERTDVFASAPNQLRLQTCEIRKDLKPADHIFVVWAHLVAVQ